MRSRSLVAAVVASLSLAACSDSPPTGASLIPFGQAPANLTLGEYIDQQIVALLPNGHAKSVAARWSTVQKAKAKGDMAGASKHFNSLADWLIKKTGDFTPPAGTTKGQAAAHLVVAMANFLYGGATTPPPVTGADVAIAIAPAGQPFLLQTPAFHAGISWGAGSTNQDRLIVLAQDPTPYPGVCTGALVTPRCQYPLFYQAHSYPDLRLNVGHPGRFAICMVETGDRRPLEYLRDEGPGGARPIDDRMRLAHDRPANPANYTAGATQEGGIEILPKAATQTGDLVRCDEPDTGAMNPVQRALYAASEFVSKIISPKSAWAWDSGPEHNFEAFSHFNGVDPFSEPDLVLSGVDIVTPPAGADLGRRLTYTVTNVSRRAGGEGTGPAPASILTAYQSDDAILDADDAVILTTAIPALGPDAAPFVGSEPISTGDYSYVLVKVAGASDASMSNNLVALPLLRAPQPEPITNTSAQQPTIDNGVGPLAIGSPISQQRVAQVFTAPATGLLTQVSFPVACNAQYSLIVEIQQASGGSPKGPTLSTTTVSGSSLPFPDGPQGFRDIPLSQGTAVVQGQQYAIVLTTADRTQSACTVSQGPTGDPYAGGAGWFDTVENQLGVWVRMSPRDDLPFKTVVTIPNFQ